MRALRRRLRSSGRFQDLKLRISRMEARLKCRLGRKDWSDADPFALVHISPTDITRMISIPDDSEERRGLSDGPELWFERKRFHKWKNLARVAGGEWDRFLRPFGGDLHHRLLTDRYIVGMKWEDSEAFRELMERVERGEALWHGCTSVDEIRARCRRVDRLYGNMASEGYRLQAELGHRSLRRRLDEVVVNIGREGELLYNSSGSHRILLARSLSLPLVPARVLVRHRGWQEFRDRVRASRSPSEIPEQDRPRLQHPDLADVLPAWLQGDPRASGTVPSRSSQAV